MDIPLLLATSPGQGPAPAGKPSPGAQGGFSLALGRAGIRTLADGGPPANGAERPPPPAPGGDPVLAQASLAVMMQALGDGEPATGNDAGLAEIVERLTLIEAAGRGAAAMPAGDLGELAPDNDARLAEIAERLALIEGDSRDAGALATALNDTAEVSPEAAYRTLVEDAPSDTEAWPTLAMTGRIPPEASGRDGPSPAANTGHARPVAPTPPALDALLNAPTGQGRPAPEPPAQAASVAGGEAQALLAGRETVPATGEPRGEGLPLATAAANGPASATPSATATSTAQGHPALTASLHSPAWPQQLGQQLVVMGQRGGEQRVELHLHPAELGPLSISLKMHDQSAQAQFLSAHASVRHAVEQALPQLREALAEQGITLGETSVGEQSRDEAPRDFAGRGTTGGPASDASEEADGHGASAPTVAADISLDGRVDLYA